MKIFSHALAVNIVKMIVVGKNQLLTGSKSGDIRLWVITKAEDYYDFQPVRAFLGHSTEICCLALLPNNRFIAVAVDQSIRIWNIASENCEMFFKLEGSISPTYSKLISATALGEELVAIGGYCSPTEGCFDVWDTLKGTCLFKQQGLIWKPKRVLLTMSGAYLSIMGECHNELSLWKISRASCMKVSAYQNNRIYSMAVLPNGEIVTGEYRLRLHLLSKEGVIGLFHIMKNGEVIDEILPLKDYKVITVDRQGGAGMLKLWDCLKKTYTVLGHSITPKGRVAHSHVVLTDSDLLLSLSGGSICIQNFPALLAYPKDFIEIRKNARILAQADRTQTSFFLICRKKLRLKS